MMRYEPWMFSVISTQLDEHGLAELFMSVRTTSWRFCGERTDLHDLLSALWAVVLRAKEIASVRLHDVWNPMTVAPEEIYARLLEISQPSSGIVAPEEVQLRAVALQKEGQATAAWLAQIFDLNGDPMNEEDPDWKTRPAWMNAACTLVGVRRKSTAYWFQTRPRTQWSYFYFWKKGISGAQIMPEAATRLRTVLGLFVPKQELDGIERHVVRTEQMRNAFELQARTQLLSLISLIDGGQSDAGTDNVTLIPIESHLIGVGKRSIVIKRTNCGLEQFEAERDLCEEKRREEAAVFLSDARFEWADEIDDQAFEDLVYDLLNVEDGVARVKKVGSVHERDGGRDLIVEWNVYPGRGGRAPLGSKGKQLRSFRRILAQIKVRETSVGKSDVTDIRDTLEHHQCDGILVVAFPRITAPLFDHLEALRRRGTLWVDWWERADLEVRLRRQVNLANRYSNIFQMVPN